MITDALIAFFTGLFGSIFSLLPDATFPVEITNTLAFIGNIFSIFSWLFPIDTLYQILFIGLTFEAIVFSVKWGVWLYNKIRGSG